MSDLRLTYYGDDFTGSTDVMEALSVNGLPTVLFLRPPTVADLVRFPECKAVGVAGVSRSETPEWMDEHLPPVFMALRELGAPICHYKVCSTFDSSPVRGSIGRAVELGRRVMGNAVVPMVVGAPVLRRYVVFGNLFATVDGESYRIDRHPTMSRHPVTPMEEGDLRRHLGMQTALSLGLVDILALQAGRGLERFREERASIVLFDTLDEVSLREAGRAIWESRGDAPMFVAGSSGVEYALLEWWRSQGLLPIKPTTYEAGAVDRVLVVSGSCSPVTGQQIRWALRNGFVDVAVDPARLVSDAAEFDRVLQMGELALSSGQSPVIYTAAGPSDVVETGGGNAIGARLGALAGTLARRSGVRRIVIAGGDTSGHAGRELGIEALTFKRSFYPGSPLCRIWCTETGINGTEIMLKGGQVGAEMLFGEVLAGQPGTT
ncbi:MAG: four-carbon acid sugar kinase family protein [Bryobacteraceae bacterium]